MNAGHPPILVWGDAREPLWLGSTGPLVSPVLTASTWDAPVVPMDEGDHLLLYTDGVSETLADEDGRAEQRFTSAIDRAAGRRSLAARRDSGRRPSRAGGPAAAGRCHAPDGKRARRD